MQYILECRWRRCRDILSVYATTLSVFLLRAILVHLHVHSPNRKRANERARHTDTGIFQKHLRVRNIFRLLISLLLFKARRVRNIRLGAKTIAIDAHGTFMANSFLWCPGPLCVCARFCLYLRICLSRERYNLCCSVVCASRGKHAKLIEHAFSGNWLRFLFICTLSSSSRWVARDFQIE